ncbi:MAG: hypothetical protein EP344_15025 [Bacteroidetes bacterium]|nr:MAG: hypothetical protein EP344_15025 [Bacteroidota bacterium]
MLCPNCNRKLSQTVRSGVEIDFCPECRGVWLDRGELDKIIERVTAEERTHADAIIDKPELERFPIYPDPEERRKRSFFSDLFDFE